MSAPPIACFVIAPGKDVADAPPTQSAAAALARLGWVVHLLDCSEEGGQGVEDAAAAGAVVHRLAEIPTPHRADVQRYGGDHPTVVLGERAQEVIEALHAEHSFDLIEFPDAGGLGMRSVQSKRSADAFADVPIAVRLAAPVFRRRADRLQMLGAPRDLKLDFCERYAFQQADIQLVAAEGLLESVVRRGWKVRPDVRTLPQADRGREGEETIDGFYRELLQRPLAAGPVAGSTATLSVVVAHYNHELHLEAALSSLAAQTRPPDEVIVIDDGSTSEAALRVFAEQETRHPDWRFIRQENIGPGATRNRGLELAAGEYFLPFDSDNIAVETMVERLLRAMEANPERAATTCHNLGFTADAEVASGRFVSRYSPTGGPQVLSAVENVYGDTCSIFRTEALRSVGGFEINRWSPTEDWETFVKMAVRGLEIDVLPRPLFYYRTDSGGRLQSLGTDRKTKLKLRAHLVDMLLAGSEASDSERRDLIESLQAFDDFITEEFEARLAAQGRWHDSQMADLDAFREAQVAEVRAELGGEASREGARAERAERELERLSRATSGRLLGRVVRWRTK